MTASLDMKGLNEGGIRRVSRRALAWGGFLFFFGLLLGLTGCKGVPVILRVEGDSLVVPGEPMLAVAYGSPPGGRYRWERLLQKEDHRIVDSRKNWAMVVSDKCGAPVFRVTYKRRGFKAIGYFVPYVIDFDMVAAGSWHPDTPEEIEARLRRERLRKEYIARMKSPEGIEELRKAIRIAYLDSSEEPQAYMKEKWGFGLATPAGLTAAAVGEVGPLAAREIHWVLPKTGEARARMMRAIVRIDSDYASSAVLPELILAGDADSILTAISVGWPCAGGDVASGQTLDELRLALASREPYVRMMVCKCVGQKRIAATKDMLTEVAETDPHAQVRQFARVALECLAPDPEPKPGLGRLALKALAPRASRAFDAPPPKRAAPDWPEISDMMFTPTTPDPEDVKKARRLYPRVRREIEKKLEFEYVLPHDPRLRITQFQLYGWAIMPITEERLAAPDCSEKERRALRLMRGALRTRKDAQSEE